MRACPCGKGTCAAAAMPCACEGGVPAKSAAASAAEARRAERHGACGRRSIAVIGDPQQIKPVTIPDSAPWRRVRLVKAPQADFGQSTMPGFTSPAASDPDMVHVIILAIVQGLAELLPVSSSAHVIVAEK